MQLFYFHCTVFAEKNTPNVVSHARKFFFFQISLHLNMLTINPDMSLSQ